MNGLKSPLFANNFRESPARREPTSLRHRSFASWLPSLYLDRTSYTALLKQTDSDLELKTYLGTNPVLTATASRPPPESPLGRPIRSRTGAAELRMLLAASDSVHAPRLAAALPDATASHGLVNCVDLDVRPACADS